MSEPAVDSGFRMYRFKHKKYSFFANTDARQWSFHCFYISSLHSGDSPKTFNEIFDKWVASLKFIQRQNKVPKSIVKFVGELMEHNQSNEFKNLQVACKCIDLNTRNTISSQTQMPNNGHFTIFIFLAFTQKTHLKHSMKFLTSRSPA